MHVYLMRSLLHLYFYCRRKLGEYCTFDLFMWFSSSLQWCCCLTRQLEEYFERYFKRKIKLKENFVHFMIKSLHLPCAFSKKEKSMTMLHILYWNLVPLILFSEKECRKTLSIWILMLLWKNFGEYLIDIFTFMCPYWWKCEIEEYYTTILLQIFECLCYFREYLIIFLSWYYLFIFFGHRFQGTFQFLYLVAALPSYAYNKGKCQKLIGI